MKKMLPVTVLSFCLLTGCSVSSLLKSNAPPQTIFSLRPLAEIEAQSSSDKALAKIIEIQRPSLPPGFDTARIGMYLDGGRRLDYYANATWPSPLDEALQEFTSQTARKVLPNAIVVAPGQSIDANYRLQIRVNDFEPVYQAGPTQAPLLVASLSFTLLAMPEERIVTNFTVEEQAQAQNNTLSAITDGLGHLLQSVEGKAFETTAGHIRR